MLALVFKTQISFYTIPQFIIFLSSFEKSLLFVFNLLI